MITGAGARFVDVALPLEQLPVYTLVETAAQHATRMDALMKEQRGQPPRKTPRKTSSRMQG